MKPQYSTVAWMIKIPHGLLVGAACGLALLLPCLASCGGSDSPARRSPPEGGVSSNDTFVVLGKITDSGGRPLGGVEVTAHCGNGTLFPTGSTVSGTDGEYRVTFGPGVLMGRSFGVSPFGVGFQAATISAHKAGYFVRGLGSAGNLGMTDSTNAAPAWSTNFAGIVRPFQPYRLDFVLQPASLIRGNLVDPSHRLAPKISLCLTGAKLPPSSSVLACVDLDESGNFEFRDVPVGLPWRFEVSWREKEHWKTLRSKPVVASTVVPRTLKITVLDDSLELEQFPW